MFEKYVRKYMTKKVHRYMVSSHTVLGTHMFPLDARNIDTLNI